LHDATKQSILTATKKSPTQMSLESSQSIASHYISCWQNQPAIKRLDRGPFWELPTSFCVLEFAPTSSREIWTYATCGMAQPSDNEPLELHLFSRHQDDLHVELLTVVAHFHRTANPLHLGDTVNFGRPWMLGSACEYGLISLPYLDGPALENFRSAQFQNTVRFLWLIPITRAEREYKIAQGIEALEQRFEHAALNYIDPSRRSVI
jgi:hypothetical protein